MESLSHYIRKHDEYSNWEARVWLQGSATRRDLPPALFGSQAQRRRWLRKKFFALAGFAGFVLLVQVHFLRWDFSMAFPGLIYCGLQGVQFFHIKAKIYELKTSSATHERN